MPTEPAQSPDDLQKQITALKQQKDLLDTQKQLLETQKALNAAQQALTPEASQLTDQLAGAKTAKEVADAQKALADAKKAQTEAQSAAFKATIGDVPQSGYTGTVDVKQGTGDLEAALLATRAVHEAATAIDHAIRGSQKTDCTIVTMAASDVPTFNTLLSYNIQVRVVRQALEDAISAAQTQAKTQGLRTEAVPLIGAVGTVLDAANKLFSFFRTDYTVGGVTVTLDDLVAIAEVANLLRQTLAVDDTTGKRSFVVTIPAIYNPKALADAGAFLVTELTQLSTLKLTADTFTKLYDAEVDTWIKAANAESTATKKSEYQKKATDAKALADALRSASTLFNTWFGKLTVVDDKGTSALVTIVKEKVISDQLKEAKLLVLKVQKAGGGYLVKKNMWTFFGGMPLYHMGGASVSFVLFNGATGTVEVSGVIPIHGGFVKAGKVQATLEK